jgi:3,4-dihydroxy 2-butanone 4-phosphate synthase/GTP cyclohydrolase II
MEEAMEFAPIEELVREIARGGMVILVDDPGRENEGDFVMAAEKASADQIRFMAAQGRGLICAPLAPEVADRLKLPQMVDQPTDPEECAFTVPVDARDGTTTGISAFDRALTARLLASPSARQRDFRRPGHLFPLRAEPGGVLTRRGHTEAAVDLARLAGLEPVGVICEVMAEDGTMARLPELRKIAARENLLIGTIADLVEYRESTGETGRPRPRRLNVRELSKATLPTPLGVFDLRVYAGGRDDEIVVLSQGDLSEGEAPLVRVHSACFTGDILGSLRCDCGGQLEMALRKIGEEGCGALIYLPQEGRGIGLAKKVEAYRLQENGLDTVEANHQLGYPADLRSYDDAAGVLRLLGARSVRLMTNNPAKIAGLEQQEIEVLERVSIEPGAGPVNLSYLRAKKGKLGHLFEAI